LKLPLPSDQKVEHGVAADRFAREIVRFLAHSLGRSRQLNTRPFGSFSQYRFNNADLLVDWELARQQQPLRPIDPLA